MTVNAKKPITYKIFTKMCYQQYANDVDYELNTRNNTKFMDYGKFSDFMVRVCYMEHSFSCILEEAGISIDNIDEEAMKKIIEYVDMNCKDYPALGDAFEADTSVMPDADIIDRFMILYTRLELANNMWIEGLFTSFWEWKESLEPDEEDIYDENDVLVVFNKDTGKWEPKDKPKPVVVYTGRKVLVNLKTKTVIREI